MPGQQVLTINAKSLFDDPRQSEITVEFASKHRSESIGIGMDIFLRGREIREQKNSNFCPLSIQSESTESKTNISNAAESWSALGVILKLDMSRIFSLFCFLTAMGIFVLVISCGVCAALRESKQEESEGGACTDGMPFISSILAAFVMWTLGLCLFLYRRREQRGAHNDSSVLGTPRVLRSDGDRFYSSKPGLACTAIEDLSNEIDIEAESRFVEKA